MLRRGRDTGEQPHMHRGGRLLRTSRSSHPHEITSLITPPCAQVENVFFPAVGDRDSDDLRQNASSPNPFPPEFYVSFLRNATVMQKIGAQARYSECSNAVGNQFGRTGDDARTLLPQLAALAKIGRAHV